MKKFYLLTKTLLVAVMLLAGTNAWGTDVPDPVYFNDFSSNTGLSIVGSGEFITDGDAHFGRIYHNNPENSDAVRTNYLQLPSTVFSEFSSTGGKTAMSIGFWVNVKNTTNYTFCPLFTAYSSAESTSFPMMALEARGLVQWNCNGYCDFGIWSNTGADYNDGTPYNSVEWLEDGDWHYYTLVLTSTTAKVYIDGELKNGWTVDGTSDGQKISGLFTDAATNLVYVCLGGNQAWDWSDKDSAFGFDDFAVYDEALTAEQIAQIVYDKLNNDPIATSVVVSGDDAVSTAEKTYVKYEFNAWTNAHEYVGGGTGATYNGSAGTGDSKGWASNTAGRQIKVTLNHPLEAGDVITVNAACSYGGTDNRCPVAIATFAQGDIKTYKYLTLRFPTTGYTSNTNYDLSYTVTETDSLCGKSELYIGGSNGTGGSIYFYFKSVKVTSDDASDAYAPQTLSTAKTWTFGDLTTGSKTSGAMIDEYMFVGASESYPVGVVADTQTISGTGYTKALDFATAATNTNLTNGVNTNVAGCMMFKVPAGYGKFTLVGRNLGPTANFYYNIGQASRVRTDAINSNSTNTITFEYNTSESKPIIIYQGKNYETSEIYLYSVTWEPLTVEATIGSTGWTTFASSYPLDLENLPSGVTAYYAASDAIGDGKVTVTEKSDEAVAAGTGLLLKGTASTTYRIPVAASGTNISASNLLVGCTSETALGTNANYYVLVNNSGTAEFQCLDENGATIPAGKAYLSAPISEARSLRIVFGDEITGISEAQATTAEATQKDGKFIENGKLVIVKNGKKYNANGTEIK